MIASQALSLFAWFVAGMALWTLLEWLVHNFLGHHGKGRNPFAREHVRHHATTHYFAPTWKKMLVGVGAAILVGVVFAQLLSLETALAFDAGLISMYAAYEIIHRRCHTHAPTGPYSRWVRLNHFHHHFRSPNTNHGVSTPIWDFVFRAYVRPQTPIRIPEKHAMAWLFDAVTGDVKEQFSSDYVIARRGGKVKTEASAGDEPPPAIAGVAAQA